MRIAIHCRDGLSKENKLKKNEFGFLENETDTDIEISDDEGNYDSIKKNEFTDYKDEIISLLKESKIKFKIKKNKQWEIKKCNINQLKNITLKLLSTNKFNNNIVEYSDKYINNLIKLVYSSVIDKKL